MTLSGCPKKRQRVGSNTSLSSATFPDTDSSPKPPRGYPPAISRFNDPVTADVLLRLHREPAPSDDCFRHSDVLLHLHSDVLRRSQYFSALLSDRWRADSDESLKDSGKIHRFDLKVPASIGNVDDHLMVLELLYADDFSGSIDSASAALSILPVALEFLFEECIDACVRFLEAVPWSEEEEKKVVSLIPFLKQEESQELLARVSPLSNDSSEEMLHGLIMSVISNHPNMAFAKAFVAKLLRDFSCRDSVRRVLDRAFKMSLKVAKESLEKYSSPDCRGDHNETEALQRINLHTAMTTGRHLLWLVERMIELKVADTAVNEWSDQVSFTADLQRAFRDDTLRNIVPGLPAVLLRCTCKLANAVTAGSIIAAREVRMKLVKGWLPVLIACKDSTSPLLPNHKSLHQELEETFLRIISTLPMLEAQGLLQQCLSFSTRNVDDCPHLVSAFNTWFRRAAQPPQEHGLH